MTRRRGIRAGLGAAGSLVMGSLVTALLAGCTGQASPAATTTVTVTATPSATVAPTPSATATATAVASATPSANATTAAAGCAANSTALPAGAMTASIGDVDGDGRPDTAFYAESAPGFRYGIRTASGATIVLPDDLAGPGAHSGWTAKLDGPAIAITVLDDGRTATLHAFIDCRFVTTYGVDGKPFRFGLAGFSDTGTGVACNDRNGGTLLEGVLAKKRSNGRYHIEWTQIDLAADGSLARVGTGETRWSDLAASDQRVTDSMRSTCGSAPMVHTSGR